MSRSCNVIRNLSVGNKRDIKDIKVDYINILGKLENNEKYIEYLGECLNDAINFSETLKKKLEISFEYCDIISNNFDIDTYLKFEEIISNYDIKYSDNIFLNRLYKVHIISDYTSEIINYGNEIDETIIDNIYLRYEKALLGIERRRKIDKLLD